MPTENRDAAQVPRPGESTPFLTVDEVAARQRMSSSSIYERTRANLIPHRKLPGSRRCLFVEAELEAWEAGAALEVVELDNGAKWVRPVEEES